MEWWKKKEKDARAYDDQKQKLILVREKGAMLLKDLIKCCDGKSNPIKFFSEDQILEATDNFSDSNKVCPESRCYDWYSGKNENHHIMLIGRHIFERERTIYRDIAISSMVSGHKNFFKLVGCCIESPVPSLVYHGVKRHYNLDISEQPWKNRMKIAEDIATALVYLHTAFPRPFVYMRLCLESILLDEDGVAKRCDLSTCILIPQGETFVKVDRGALIYGYYYMDHDYLNKGIISEKTDVFSIGIFMQELLTGEDRFHHFCEGEDGEGDSDSDDYVPERKVINWLSKSMEEGRMDAIADPKLIEEMGEISEEEFCRMKAFLMLSLRCIGHTREVPTMMEVAKELKNIQRSL